MSSDMESSTRQNDVFAGLRQYDSPDSLKPPASPTHSTSSAEDFFVVQEDQEQENVFATSDNFVDCAKYVNETLSRYGLPGPIRVERMDTVDKVRALNALHALIQDKQTAARAQDEMQMELAKLREERERSHHRVLDLKQVIDQKDKEKWDREMRLRNLQAESSAVEKKLRLQLDELQKKCVQIKNRDKQYKHDLRKREKEYEKLQEKIKKMRGAPREKGGIISMSNVVLGRSQRKAWRGQRKGEEVLQQQMQETYEERIQELMDENADLRAGFRVLSDRLEETLASHGGVYADIPEENLEITVNVSDEVRDALESYDPATQLSMPYQVAGEAFAGGFDAKLQLLQSKIDAMLKISKGSKTKALLERELAEAKVLLERQNELLKEAVSQSEPNDLSSFPNKRWSAKLEGITEHEEKCAEDRRKFEEEERILREQREELEAEFALNASLSLPASPQKNQPSSHYSDQSPSRIEHARQPSNVSHTSHSSQDGVRSATKRTKRTAHAKPNRGRKPSRLAQIEPADFDNVSPPTSPE